MLGFDRAGAAVADDLKLRVRLRMEEEGASCQKQEGDGAANVHESRL
jgi:hypothetical protein